MFKLPEVNWLAAGYHMIVTSCRVTYGGGCRGWGRNITQVFPLVANDDHRPLSLSIYIYIFISVGLDSLVQQTKKCLFNTWQKISK